MSESNFMQIVPNSYQGEGVLEKFPTGATRHNDAEKPDYEGFLSPLVVESFGKYMHTHRKQADGSLRDSDNWQKGIPLPKYMKSLWRHLHAAWKLHRGWEVEAELIGGKWVTPTLEDCLNGILFNTMGYLHEYLKQGVGKDKAPSQRRKDNVENIPNIFQQLQEEAKRQASRSYGNPFDPNPYPVGPWRVPNPRPFPTEPDPR